MSDWIKLNIGGQVFHTTRTTLFSEPNSMLAKMFASEQLTPCNQDDQGNFLIDRSPRYFEPLLNYLRCGKLIIDPGTNIQGVFEEAKYYGIESVIQTIESMMDAQLEQDIEDPPLTRKEVVKILASTEGSRELRFQGLNLKGTDLSKLDLRNINFKYAKMQGCNLQGANLNRCNLERADMSASCLDNAQLVNVRMVCANLESVSFRNCNFEGNMPSNMEGCNLKNAILEGSQMAEVNLRVSCLRGANMRDCQLRAANLAGADLELCDLSGSDLNEANLRGSNLKDTLLESMQSPLHMSQTIR